MRTVPRGGTPGAAPAITAANVPPIARRPAAENAIRMQGDTLLVPTDSEIEMGFTSNYVQCEAASSTTPSGARSMPRR